MTQQTDTDPADELRGLVTRLEQMLALPSVTPAAATDDYGNPGSVAAGELIESAWGNAVADHVLHRFPNKAAMDGWNPAQGVLAVTADNIVYIRDSGAWKPTAIGNRVTFRVVGGGAGQGIPSGVVTLCTWAGEAADGFNVVSGGLFTVPAGWAGRWDFDWAVNFPGPSTGVRQAFAQVSPTARLGFTSTMTQDSAGPAALTGAASVLLAAGQTVGVYMYHTHTAGLPCNQSTDQYFQGHYSGPF